MLRVLALSTLFPDASRPNFGIFVEQKLRALASREGVSLRVVSPVGIPPWPLSLHPRYRALGALPRQEEWRGLEVHRPRFANIPGAGGRFHAAMIERAVAPLLEAFDFDLITAEFLFPDGPAAVALGKRFGVPVSMTARGADVHHWARSPTVGEQVIAAGKAASAIVTVSRALRDDLIALGLDGAKIHPIANGVDFSRFPLADRVAAKAALGLPGPLVASIGALIPRKGHDIVIDAVAALPGISLHIAGEGPERAALEARIARLGVQDRIRLLGPVAHADLPPLLAAADVMALASSSEGLANVWLEALASGTPLAIPDIGGARQVIRAPEAGRLADRSSAGFADAIAALLATPPDRAAVRAQAAPFTWEANSAAILSLFQALAGHPSQNATIDAAA